MSDPYLSQMIIFGGNFAIRGWALCDGQLLAISQNQALFSLLGTIFGGDGRTTFGLPEARGRAVIGTGTGAGLTQRNVGARGGFESVVLSTNELAAHTHSTQNSLEVATAANAAAGDVTSPADAVLAMTSVTIRGGGQATANIYAGAPEANESMAGGPVTGAVEVGLSGTSLGHDNMQPYLALNYLIAMVGTYPSRN